MKATVPSLDAVPESLRSEYEKQADGSFALKVEGAPAGFVPAKDLAETNTKLAEFRENNRALNALKTELETKLAGVKDLDPVKFKAMEDELAVLHKKAPEGAAELTALKSQIETLGRQIADSNKAREDASAALVRKDLEQTITTAGIKAGLLEHAIPDLLMRGLQTFVVENGTAVAKRSGAPLFSKKNGASPLTIEEWVGDTLTEAPHLFKPSQGGGAAPGPGGNGGGNGTTRTIAEGAKLSAQDLSDIASGKAVRAEATVA